ncbi:MAG: ketopantoate reductase C-terminal domain-containing protein [Burkholderiaceae bacterium]
MRSRCSAGCAWCASIAGPGHIRHVGAKPTIRFGELDDSRSARVQRVLDAFAQARGVVATTPENMWAALWTKFMLITAFSGIGAVTRVPIGEFRREGGSRRLLERVMTEIVALATARGVTMPADLVATQMRHFDTVAPESTASMQRDMMAGRPSELEDQTGAVVRIGRRLGVETPVNQFIYDCLLPQERLARERAGGGRAASG